MNLSLHINKEMQSIFVICISWSTEPGYSKSEICIFGWLLIGREKIGLFSSYHKECSMFMYFLTFIKRGFFPNGCNKSCLTFILCKWLQRKINEITRCVLLHDNTPALSGSDSIFPHFSTLKLYGIRMSSNNMVLFYEGKYKRALV